MKNIFKRIIAVIGLCFIVSCFLVSFPFAALWYIVTGHDLTAKIDSYIHNEKKELFK